MRFLVRMLQATGLVGLIAVMATAAEDQPKPAQNSTGKPAAASPKSVLQSSPEVASRMARRLAGPGAKTVGVEDVVEGGVYYEDPVSGKLILGEAPSKAGGPSARVAQALGASRKATVASRSAAIASRKASVEDVVPMEVTTEEFGEFGDPCCDDGTCGECSSCLVPCGVLFPAGNLELFAGVQGFTGPANWPAGGGSFGFNEGLNWGMPIPLFGCLGGQVGFRATQSNLSGTAISDDTRRQAFVTAGLFRRVDVGLQGGVVVDWLSDGWYRDVDLVNLRTELSWVIDSTHEVGFWGTFGTRNPEEPGENDELADWETTDLYAVFYRYSFGGCRDGDARLFAGFSSQSDGLIGADARLPLSDTWALETNFAYLIPNEGDGDGADADFAQESWNVGINLVWYPGRRWGRGDRYYRPLFRVADNGVFMMDQTLP